MPASHGCAVSAATSVWWNDKLIVGRGRLGAQALRGRGIRAAGGTDRFHAGGTDRLRAGRTGQLCAGGTNRLRTGEMDHLHAEGTDCLCACEMSHSHNQRRIACVLKALEGRVTYVLRKHVTCMVGNVLPVSEVPYAQCMPLDPHLLAPQMCVLHWDMQ